MATRSRRARSRKLLAGSACAVAMTMVSFTPVAANDPSQTPASGKASNMGVCSPFLGQLGVRPMVNSLVREMGQFLPDGPYANVGELYRIRAKEKPTASAAEECLPRREGGHH
jgi:hypothetical protein